jgi:NADP-reducing hydrogenase subunit HndC
MARLNSPAELEKLRGEIVSGRDPQKPCITICSGTACNAGGSSNIAKTIEQEIEKQGLKGKVDFRKTGCHGFCERGPILVINPEEICYIQVKAEDISEIISSTIKEKKVIDRLLYTDPTSGKKITYESEIPFYKNQQQMVFGLNRHIDPGSIEDYIYHDGYHALGKALSGMTPEQVLDEVMKSGIRGRGGAGFPAGRKWETTRKAEGEPKYVIVNADEGDPGAYMDRSILEGNPHRVLEGLILCAYAIGSHEGYIYVRAEYPLAVDNVRNAVRQAEEYGLLGKNILNSGFDFNVRIHRGAGAFVSGESSALMNAIEGKVGEPRPKYVRTAVSGVNDKPSNLNNVETYANVPLIIDKGGDWFASIGTKGSTGTKIFSLVGKVNNTGLVEIPMGVTLRRIIYDIGGGIPGGKKFKAVQTGGPAGGVIPEKYLDAPVDFDELTKLGSIMGSGGMIVMDEDTCVVDVARYFIDFLCDESCGKCIPCREGLKHMREILTDIVEGKGKESDIDLLQEIAGVMSSASLCALGTSAPNPVLTTIKYFKDEFEAHIKERRCPALVCKALVSYYIDPAKCMACMICARQCPVQAISGGKNLIHIIDQTKCTRCGTCIDACPPRFSAVTRISGRPVPLPLTEDERIVKRGKQQET